MSIKTLYKNAFIFKVSLLLFVGGCSDFLNEDVYTQYDPESYLQTEEGINSVLVSSYSNLHVTSDMRERMYTFGEFTGDIMWEWGGGFEAIATVYMTFNWDAQNSEFILRWTNLYQSIRNANALLDNIDKVTSLSDEKVKQLKAEATFIRAADYYYLWELFGPVPLITTAAELDLEPARATESDFSNFIEKELQNAADGLPVTQAIWGKATKGAALALLGKFYMNTHEWGKAADINAQVIGLNKYKLFSGNIINMFSVENEENDEVIFTSPALPALHGNNYMAHAFPPNYPIQSNWINFGAQFCVRKNFIESYHPDDKRLGWMLLNYTDSKGVYHNLLDPADKGRAPRCFKYVPDPNGISDKHGNDVPMIRYAEILLNRAEALNELNGPNQESVDLLNQVRRRAGVPSLGLADFPTKESFRGAILNERGWEFVAEGLRRMDLIRHGKFISQAINRGVAHAKDYMTRFPIPQLEISANPNLKPNPGY